MIAFSCSHCGMKLKVKPEFAGRSSRCPTCKTPLVVPALESTAAYVPQGPLDGTPSSVAQAGLDAGVTLAHTGDKPVAALLAGRAPKGERYLIADEIARGGMGAVLRAVDRDIRREVAVKFLLDQTDPKKKLRFVEEAQITGQLEHPNIVPIHELGVDTDKRLFFAMKMVKGRSLAEVLDALRNEPKTAEKEWPLGRLLNIFVNICHALAYAHARNVVHRDLKPANIMVGDFGEVYVMDWGLAKVLKSDRPAVPVASAAIAPPSAEPAVLPVAATVPAPRPSKVETSRADEADLTREGAILGTPAYMPPEQAAGRLDAIDQRSDIYSLGAILYELLTLQTPVDRAGGYVAVLLRVAEGAIVPPEQRARAGQIPRELSAVAMKSMAKEPADRYPNVEALRRDIERFQDGRSVSAKQDTKREMLWKFVKRNKGFSAGAALSLFVLLGSVGLLARAWLETKQAYAQYQTEQDEKQRRTKEAVPAFLGAARMWGENRNLDAALIQVSLALDYDPDNPAAHLLKGQVLIAQMKFETAGAALDRYVALRPEDADAKELRRLCHQAQPDDGERLLALVDVLVRQKALGLSDCLWQEVSKLVAASEKLLPVLRKRIEASWPKLGTKLTVQKNGKLFLQFAYCGAQVRDLSPLRGMPLDRLDLRGCDRVRDLTPLHGLPLTWLSLQDCGQVSDLTPLHGLPLTWLSLGHCDRVSDLTPLQDMKLNSLELTGCVRVRDLTPLHGLPLTVLSLWDCGQVSDLTPLHGLPLTRLNLNACPQVSDLSPLKGMPLTWLNLNYCDKVLNLTPLQGMKLTSLGLPSRITADNLTALQGLPLTSLWVEKNNRLRDLTPLKGLRLTSLSIRACSEVHDLTPLKGMPLTSLNLIYCGKVQDLTPLAGMELQDICLTPKTITNGMDVLRQMKSLKTVSSDWNKEERWSAAEFWKKYDAGEFNK